MRAIADYQYVIVVSVFSQSEGHTGPLLISECIGLKQQHLDCVFIYPTHPCVLGNSQGILLHV